jgi:hypothetical protein
VISQAGSETLFDSPGRTLWLPCLAASDEGAGVKFPVLVDCLLPYISDPQSRARNYETGPGTLSMSCTVGTGLGNRRAVLGDGYCTVPHRIEFCLS